MKVSRLVLTAFVVALVGTTAWAADDVEDIQTIRMKSNDAIARHDVDALQSYLDEDFVITISTGAIERSRDEHGERPTASGASILSCLLASTATVPIAKARAHFVPALLVATSVYPRFD